MESPGQDGGRKGMDPELQLLKYKRKSNCILEILRARAQREDVEDFVSTIESVIPIINRILTQLRHIDKQDLNDILFKLHTSLEEYEQRVVALDKTGRLKRFLTSNRLRKKLEKLNSTLHKDIEYFVEIIIQVEVKNAEREQEEDKFYEQEQLLVQQQQELLRQQHERQQRLRQQHLTRTASEISMNNFAPRPREPEQELEEILEEHRQSQSPPSIPRAQQPPGPVAPQAQPMVQEIEIRTDETATETPVMEAPAMGLAQGIDLTALSPEQRRLLLEEESPKMQKLIQSFDPSAKYSNFMALQLTADLFKDEWDLFFGNERMSMVQWSKFMEFIRSHIQVNNDEEKIFKYVLDNSNTGLISKHKYSLFLKGFGPLPMCLANLKEIFHYEWFYGYLSSRESEVFLKAQPSGTFLVRLSKSEPGAFALAFCHGPRVIHILINSNQPEGFSILDQESNSVRRFKNLTDVIKFYQSVLQRPFTSTIPLKPWFQGDLSGDEVQELMAGQPHGTFLIRFSSQLGNYAATYVDKEGLKHALIEHRVVDLIDNFKIRGEEKSFPTMDTLINFYGQALRKPLRHSETEVDLGTVKDIVHRLYDPNELEIARKRAEEKAQEEAVSAPSTVVAAKEEIPQAPAPVVESKEEESVAPVQELDAIIKSHEVEEKTENKRYSVHDELQEKKANLKTSPSEEYEYVAKLGLNDKKYPTRWLYLFNDSLSLSAHEFSLTSTWIEPLSEDFKDGMAFRIISPERRIVVVAGDKQEMREFLAMVRDHIFTLLKKDRHLVDETGRKRFAKYTFQNGAYYEGEWEQGVFHGFGTHLLVNGQKYTGEWAKGLREGPGTLLDSNGDLYEGEFKDNQRHGYGVYKFAQKGSDSLVRYEGYWQQDKRNGMGDLFYSDGSILSCEWQNDEPVLRNKIATLVYPNKDKYVGECVPAKTNSPLKFIRSGYGICVFEETLDRFYGFWQNDKPHGQGFWLGKEIHFKGEWRDSKIHGAGVMLVSKASGKENVLMGYFSGDLSLGPQGNLEIKQATVKHSEANSKVTQQQASMLRGDQWQAFLKQSKFVNFKKNMIARALDEGILLPPSEQVDHRKLLSKIMNCDAHTLGAITQSFVQIFNALYRRIADYTPKFNIQTMLRDIHGFIGCMTNYVWSQYNTLNTDQEFDNVVGAISDAVFEKIYDVMFVRFVEEHNSFDVKVADQLKKLNASSTPFILQVVGVEDHFWVGVPSLETLFEDAIREVRNVTNLKTPATKVKCLIGATRTVELYLSNVLGHTEFGADQLLPCICYVTARANVPNLRAQLEFIEEFMDEASKTGMEGYMITQFRVATDFLIDVSLQKTPEEEVKLGKGRYSVIIRDRGLSRSVAIHTAFEMDVEPPQLEEPAQSPPSSQPQSPAPSQPQSPQPQAQKQPSTATQPPTKSSSNANRPASASRSGSGEKSIKNLIEMFQK